MFSVYQDRKHIQKTPREEEPSFLIGNSKSSGTNWYLLYSALGETLRGSLGTSK